MVVLDNIWNSNLLMKSDAMRLCKWRSKTATLVDTETTTTNPYPEGLSIVIISVCSVSESVLNGIYLA